MLISPLGSAYYKSTTPLWERRFRREQVGLARVLMFAPEPVLPQNPKTSPQGRASYKTTSPPQEGLPSRDCSPKGCLSRVLKHQAKFIESLTGP